MSVLIIQISDTLMTLDNSHPMYKNRVVLIWVRCAYVTLLLTSSNILSTHACLISICKVSLNVKKPREYLYSNT